jgi:hypothetical protein
MHTSFSIAIVHAIKGRNKIKSLRHSKNKVEVKKIKLKKLI